MSRAFPSAGGPAAGGSHSLDAPASSAAAAASDASHALGRAFLQLVADAGVDCDRLHWTRPAQGWDAQLPHERILYTTRDESFAVLLHWRDHSRAEMRSFRTEELQCIALRLGVSLPSFPPTRRQSVLEQAHNALAEAISGALEQARERVQQADIDAAPARAMRSREQVLGLEAAAVDDGPDQNEPDAADSDQQPEEHKQREPDKAPRTPPQRKAKERARGLSRELERELRALPDLSGRSADDDGVYGGAARGRSAHKPRHEARDREADAPASSPGRRQLPAGKRNARGERTPRRDASPSSSSSEGSTDSRKEDRQPGRRRHSNSSTSSSSSRSSSYSSSDDRRHRRRRSRSPPHTSASALPLVSRRVLRDLADLGFYESIAPGTLANILRRFPSVLAETQSDKLQSMRNQREVTLLARVADLLRAGRHDAALELVVRRYTGVRQADASGNWTLADVLEGVTTQEVNLPQSILAKVAKRANALAAFQKIGSSGTTTADHAGSSAAPSSGGAKRRRKPSSAGGSSRGGSGSASHKGGSSSSKKASGGAHSSGDSRRQG